MRKKQNPEKAQPDHESSSLATGLVWGMLHSAQFETAEQLCLACLQVWPENPALQLMACVIKVELDGVLAPEQRTYLEQHVDQELAAQILKRVAAFELTQAAADTKPQDYLDTMGVRPC